ncbi:DUF1801 domain-containing protein [uncultured Gimesia sp.]|uniref:DUF1801 domain-containing protein n=1 Tax=uncultured Gimesia sp. TaxID=1678688 RepID=UPI003456BA75
MIPEVDGYISKSPKWQAELTQLRRIILDCQLTEAWKWRAPCYTFQNSNIVLMSVLKEYCALSFFKGALLKDTREILKKPGENTQAARLIRFTSVQEIVALEPVLKAYLSEAVEVEQAGLKVDFKKEPEPVPEELQNKLDELPAFKTAFAALTPGRQRAYLMHFSAPKQAKTRESRIEKCMPRILDGKGLNDCTCGLSQKLPACDGSHKQIR